jgi:hypothetical protein
VSVHIEAAWIDCLRVGKVDGYCVRRTVYMKTCGVARSREVARR